MSRRRDGMPSCVIEDDFLYCDHCRDKACNEGRRLAVDQVRRRAEMNERERCAKLVEDTLLTKVAPLFHKGDWGRVVDELGKMLFELNEK